MKTVMRKGTKEGVETWQSAADRAARGEKVCEKEEKVELGGRRRDVVATLWAAQHSRSHLV